MYVPGMPSARQNMPNHFDALSPVGRIHPARPLVHELSFDSYDSKSKSRSFSRDRDRSSDGGNSYDGRRSRADYDDHRSSRRYYSRDKKYAEDNRKDLRSQSEWEERPYHKKTRYNNS